MSKEDFSKLLDEFLGKEGLIGRVVKGTVTRLEDDYVFLDVGLKSEGRLTLRDFGFEAKVAPGDTFDVFIERYEDREGLVGLSREKARREEAWSEMEKSLNSGERVTGIIQARVKGGFTVDLGGVTAFLPGSQVDIRPIKDITPLMNVPQPFQILKMDKVRGNIVVSRRSVLEETRAEQRTEIMKGLSEHQIVEGIVKNITDYGAFIDLGGVDGLLHVTDISWKRVNHPAEVLSVGQTVKVQIIRFSPETQRISLGMKQLEADPWQTIEGKYKVGSKVKGKVTNIADYGAFVELEQGIEGLVHVSELSWTKKNIHPSKIVSSGQDVEIEILEVDLAKRRISLGLKQCQDNPWEAYGKAHKIGDTIKGEIRNITEFGLFVALTPELDGMVHLSDISASMKGDEAIKEYKKGDMVEARIIDMDLPKERISLGIKQLSSDDISSASDFKKNAVVTCVVSRLTDGGIEVDVSGVSGFIKKADLSRDRSEQRVDRFAVGDKVDAKILAVDAKTRKLSLSIKARELAEEKEAMAEYGSTDSGASLGDILGAALAKGVEKKSAAKATPKKATAKKKADESDAEEAEEKPAKKTAKKKKDEE